MTRKGSKQLTDDERASQVASQVAPQEEDQTIFKDSVTLTEAGRKSQEFFNTPERIKNIRDVQARREKNYRRRESRRFRKDAPEHGNTSERHYSGNEEEGQIEGQTKGPIHKLR